MSKKRLVLELNNCPHIEKYEVEKGCVVVKYKDGEICSGRVGNNQNTLTVENENISYTYFAKKEYGTCITRKGL